MISKQWTECLFIMVVTLMIRTVRILVIWLLKIGWIGITLALRKDVALISRIRGGSPISQCYGCYGNDGGRSGSAGACVTGFVGDVGSGDGYGDNGASGGLSHGWECRPYHTESKDPRNEFETVHGMPVYYGGNLNDSDCETPGNNDYDTWEDWCDSDILDRHCGFPPDDAETSCPS